MVKVTRQFLGENRSHDRKRKKKRDGSDGYSLTPFQPIHDVDHINHAMGADSPSTDSCGCGNSNCGGCVEQLSIREVLRQLRDLVD